MNVCALEIFATVTRYRCSHLPHTGVVCVKCGPILLFHFWGFGVDFTMKVSVSSPPQGYERMGAYWGGFPLVFPCS